MARSSNSSGRPSARKSASGGRSAGSPPQMRSAGGSGARRSDKGRPISGKEKRAQYQRENRMRRVWAVVGIVAAILLVAVVVVLVLGQSSLFAIASIEADSTKHVSDEDIQNLVQVEEGTTLLNVDTDAIEESLKQDTWVSSVSFTRSFPDTLVINITEREVGYLVVMGTGTTAWYLGSDGVWIEPVTIEASSDQSVADAALELALEEGVLLVTDVPSTVSPVAGSEATDEVFDVIGAFQEGFSSSFNALIVSYSASSADSVSCVLTSGVEVSLGSASSISYKEEIVTQLLDLYAGQITYINVRTPSNATYRKISTDTVEAGSGTTAGTSSEDATTTDDSTSEDASDTGEDEGSDAQDSSSE